jgi:hypothetical protein
MSKARTKAAPAYLREARREAGYASRYTASTGVPYSPETIGRHERGDVSVLPEDMLIYAKSYRRQDILLRYCADCPVGQAIGKKVTDRDLPSATLRLTQRLRRAEREIAETLEVIADDGVVDSGERQSFESSLQVLRELGEAITDLMLYAATPPGETEKSRLKKDDSPMQDYSISRRTPCQPPKNAKNERRTK